MHDLVDLDYPDADRIRVVMDNLSTHTACAVYQTFPAAEARRILQRLNSTTRPATRAGSIWPRSRSASCADSVLTAVSTTATCSNTRLTPGSDRRTESGAQIRLMFSTDQAREKMAKSYPIPLLNES